MYLSDTECIVVLVVSLFIIHWTVTACIEIEKGKSRDTYSQINDQKFASLYKLLEKTNEELINVKDGLAKLKRKPRIELPVETEDNEKNQ